MALSNHCDWLIKNDFIAKSTNFSTANWLHASATGSRAQSSMIETKSERHFKKMRVKKKRKHSERLKQKYEEIKKKTCEREREGKTER